MSEPTEEFYKELTKRMESAGTEAERREVFEQVHEEFGVDPEDANAASLESWAVRIQCTPDSVTEKLDSTRFMVMLTPQELQAIILAQSDHGRYLLGADEFDRVRDMHTAAMRAITEAAMPALQRLEDLYVEHHDEFTALAEVQQAKLLATESTEEVESGNA